MEAAHHLWFSPLEPFDATRLQIVQILFNRLDVPKALAVSDVTVRQGP